MVDPVWHELRDLVHSKQFQQAAALLVGNPRLVSLTNGAGKTVLHDLAVANEIDGVAWLHAHGFDLDTQNRLGVPVVFEVAQSGHKELLLWLKQAGANFQAVDGEGNAIIDYLRRINTDEVREMIEFVSGLFLPDS